MVPTTPASSPDDAPWPTEATSKSQQVRLRKFLKPILYSRIFTALQVTALTFALFGGGAWTIADIPDSPGTGILDSLMLCVTFLFILEIILTSIVEKVYRVSSFLWMDILGTLSMVFEISFLLGSAGKLSNSGYGNVDGALLRAVRATKVAARAGRLTKILKCISVAQAYRFRGKTEALIAESVRDIESGQQVQAKILSARLVQTLSTRVSLLTLVLVLVVPLFQIGTYPEEDLSMRAWTQRLEDEYGRAYEAVNSGGVNQTDIFRRALLSFMAFYADSDYHPYLVTGFPSTVTLQDGRVVEILDLPMPLVKTPPVRMSNIVRQAVPSCVVEREACYGDQVQVFFDFTASYKASAGMDILTIIFIIAVMAAASANLTNVLDHLVVRPIEQILTMVKTKASRVLKSLGEDDGEDDDEENDPTRKSETKLLEHIFSKLARLTTLASGGNVTTEAEFRALDDAGKGVLVDMMHVEVVADTPTVMKKVTANMDPSFKLHSAVAGMDPLDRELLESWNCDLLSMDPDSLQNVVTYIFFESHWRAFLASSYADFETFSNFCDAVRANYNDVPYHNYIHATDACHTAYRLMRASGVSCCFSDIEKYSLLVAAMGHDLGHPGVTNQFLVETKHELALRWHDKSPLENMHCAKLFEICSRAESDVFRNADKEERRRARKVCIATILHTDLVHHMDMVKSINRIYEMSSDIFEAQAAAGSDLRTSYDEIFRKDSIMWLQMLLHMADISNPLKPFHTCEAWAHRVMAEFFDQGDEEKKLGLPVGMLNDRDKINKLGCHHGFINFLVAPLVLGAVQVCPPLHILGTQMVSNLSTWFRLWVEDANPPQDEVKKRELDIKLLQETTEKQRARIG